MLQKGQRIHESAVNYLKREAAEQQKRRHLAAVPSTRILRLGRVVKAIDILLTVTFMIAGLPAAIGHTLQGILFISMQ